MEEIFVRATYINLDPAKSDYGLDLYFERSGTSATNAEVEALRSDYERTLNILKQLSVTTAEFKHILNQLLAGAQVGLVGKNYNIQDGRGQLDSIQRQMLKFGRTNRDIYLWTLAKTAFVIFLATLVLCGLLYFVVPRYLSDQEMLAAYRSALAWIVPICLLHPGAALGVVFVGFVINRTITFEKIAQFDPYYFSPPLRFLYVSVVGYVLFAALWFKLVMLGLGGYLLNDVRTEPAAGLLIGLVCGVSEALVVELLLNRLRPVERSNSHP